MDTSMQLAPPLKCELGLLSRPDGSALFCQDDTSVTAAVYGPLDVRISKEKMDGATIEVIYRPKVGQPGCTDRMQENDICRACESAIISTLYPRSSITVILQEMHNNGSLLACCINATCMALLDAAVPLHHTIAAVGCCIDENGLVKINPTKKDEETAEAQMTFAFDSQKYDVVLTRCTGSFSVEQFNSSLQTCKHIVKTIFATYRESLQRKFKE